VLARRRSVQDRQLLAVAQDENAVREPDQLGFLERADDDARSLRSRPAYPAIDVTFGADVDAARRFVEEQ
jgi:hypothetical protein